MEANLSAKKVLIIGIDGFSWRAGRNLMAEGVMPNLARLVETGCHGNLLSTIPFTTAPAWSSFMTGCNPAKTGVLTFHKFDRTQKKLQLNSFADIAVPSMWQVASDASRRVISINMPLTYPAPRIEGIIIPGLLCPEFSAETVSPGWAYDKYIKPAEGYRVVNSGSVPIVEEFINQQIATERVRGAVAGRMIREEQWNLFSYQIQSSDHVQHRLWGILTGDSLRADLEEVYRFYKACDEVIGDLVTAAGSDAVVMVVSDHGFTGVTYNLRLNAWLRKKGFLNIRQKSRTKWQIFKDSLKANVPLAGSMLHLWGRYMGGKKELFSEKASGEALASILDMDRTRAIQVAHLTGMLYLNVPETERSGLAVRLRKDLMGDLGPGTEPQIIARIEKGTETFSGLDEQAAPDLVLHYCDGVLGHLDALTDDVISGIINEEGALGLTGTHEREGVWVVSGKGVKPGVDFDSSIVDIAPTVLAALGVAVPRYMDGRVLSEVFTEPPVVEYSDTKETGGAEGNYSVEEQAEMEKHLRDLGYM